MNLSNFIKSTVELHSNLILKGEQQKVVSIITKLTLTNDGQTILLHVANRPSSHSGLTLGQLRAQTRLSQPQAKLWLVNPTSGLTSPLFGYYLRKQFLILKWKISD